MNVGYQAGPAPEAFAGERNYYDLAQMLGGDVLYNRDYLKRFYPQIDEGYNPYADPGDIHYNPIFDPNTPFYNPGAASAWSMGRPVTKTGNYLTQAGKVVTAPTINPNSPKYSAYYRSQEQRNLSAAQRRWGQATAPPRTPKPPKATWETGPRSGYYGPTGRYLGIGHAPGEAPHPSVAAAYQDRMYRPGAPPQGPNSWTRTPTNTAPGTPPTPRITTSTRGM